jgi:hypothetical protein
MAGGIGRGRHRECPDHEPETAAGHRNISLPVSAQSEPSRGGARVNREGVLRSGFTQSAATAGGRQSCWPGLDRDQRKSRRPRAEGARGRHGMSKAATTPARNTLGEG